MSHRSRQSEDTDNPHWSPRWAGWGFTNAYLDDGYEDDSKNEYLNDVVTEFNFLYHQAQALMEQPDTTGLVGVWPSREDELFDHEDISSVFSSTTDYTSSSGSDSGLPYPESGDSPTGLAPLELTEADLE
jgi:hypothetical protein